MNVTKTKLDEVLIIDPQVFGDARGWFMETYSKKKMPEIDTQFVQDNHSYSAQKGTIRGIHFQRSPMAQAKLLRCTRGAIMDFAVDLRPNSDTFKQWVGVELSEENKKQIYIPRGFGHAFITLTDDVEVLYKADNYYSPEHDAAIHWSDPEINIFWGVESPIVSEKDSTAPLLKEIRL
ncbi:MAG: dTDP-4-dehydrorhamnose 3,5-epimerase [Oscillospiraceae bacterium]|nr:dTDP-4-dehydrorhamnose 3,5-epimerase [Oscillospiraceae bacterium]